MNEFRSIFVDLEMELEEAGYETVPEFYTDTLFEDYELRIGNTGGGASNVEGVVARFREHATQFLADPPNMISKLQVAEPT